MSIRILIADDSVVSRQMLRNLLEQVPGFEVSAVASNGRTALERLRQSRPDIVILDLEMPEIDGFEVLKIIRQQYERLPVIIFSALSDTDASLTIQALSLGADDFVTKPSVRDKLSPEALAQSLREAFVPRILALTESIRASDAQAQPELSPKRPAQGNAVTAIAIGVSTGGPNALSVLLPSLPGDLALPLFLVQHMPPLFTRSLAERLDKHASLKICEAHDGMPVLPGTVYVAPGNYHLDLRADQASVRISLHQLAPENGCRPAVDVTFRAMARIYGSGALAVVMTGMGADGLRGCESIRAAGGRIYVQDEASSTIWGMPGHVARAGLADKILALDRLGAEITRQARRARPARTES